MLVMKFPLIVQKLVESFHGFGSFRSSSLLIWILLYEKSISGTFNLSPFAEMLHWDVFESHYCHDKYSHKDDSIAQRNSK